MPRSNQGIEEIFAEVPRTYRLVNRILTGGLDGAWRGETARMAAAEDGSRWLDACTGTGDMAIELRRRGGASRTVVGVDFSLPMLRTGAARVRGHDVSLVAAAACSLPFGDGAFDLVTVSFAARNCNVSREAFLEALREFRRVLKPGGVFLNLETSQPPSRLMRMLFHIYARSVVGPLGRFISGSRAGYAYLSHTLPRFYGAGELAGLIEEAGFSQVSFRRFTFGVVAVHRAVR
jgi:demethylmenaquinone methyltransferase/2-methoxy-6-polyprenyl-1,4-benzoquinol methylase